MSNYAFIDAQNLYLATTRAERPWRIDLKRFRVYLAEKYLVTKAYYFLGVFDDAHRDMYQAIQEYGYILVFREHSKNLIGKKKGNVDVDVVFLVMRKLYEREDFSKVVLVSGDGDYKRMVDYLIKENRFERILLPNKKRASSLYKKISPRYQGKLDDENVMRKISRKDRKENAGPP